MAYQTVYHGYDETFIFTAGITLVIAIRHLGGWWYMANIPRLRAVSRHSVLRRG